MNKLQYILDSGLLVKKTNKCGGRIGKGIGYAAALAGVIYDGVGVYNYYKNPDAQNVVSPTKFGVNTSMTGYGLFINPAAAMLYFGVDAFYPGGWLGNNQNPGALMDQQNRIQEIRQVVPNFNMYKEFP
jgi:hypothetical protein